MHTQPLTGPYNRNIPIVFRKVPTKYVYCPLRPLEKQYLPQPFAMLHMTNITYECIRQYRHKRNECTATDGAPPYRTRHNASKYLEQKLKLKGKCIWA